MLPLTSDRPIQTFPFVTVGLILANLWVFWLQVFSEGSLHMSVMRYGMIPADLFQWGPTAIDGRVAALKTVATSMFMHGGLLHLGGNMLYLWVFGRNVEDDFGHFRFLVFYLVAGLFATLAFAAAYPGGTSPLVGASGAIAGVLGAYFLRFPFSRIRILFFFIIIIRVIAVPAFFLLGFWFAMQIGSCYIAKTAAEGAAGQGGVAWISHIAGFVFGLVFTLFELRRRFYVRKTEHG